MKKVIWLLFSLFMINSAFSQSDNDHTVKIKKSKSSSKNIEVEIVYKKKADVNPTTTEAEKVTTDKTRFLIKRKEKSITKPVVEKVISKPTEEKTIKPIEKNTVFTFGNVDLVPVFSSCVVNGKKSSNNCFKSGISKFIQENFEYPEEAIEDGITGIVTIKFTINKEGKVVDISATDANDTQTLTNYSVELISKLPKLEAAQKDGKPVATSYEFQLDFSL